jgi:hypothetical protein
MAPQALGSFLICNGTPEGINPVPDRGTLFVDAAFSMYVALYRFYARVLNNKLWLPNPSNHMAVGKTIHLFWAHPTNEGLFVRTP